MNNMESVESPSIEGGVSGKVSENFTDTQQGAIEHIANMVNLPLDYIAGECANDSGKIEALAALASEYADNLARGLNGNKERMKGIEAEVESIFE